MSPLPLARRYALPQPALQPTHRGDSPTVTVTVTVTEWRTTPQPTPTSLTNSVAGMSRDALATSTERPLIHCPTSEMLALPTVSATSGPSSESTLRSGLVAGAIAGALAGVLFVIALAVGYVLLRRRKCVRAALRVGNVGRRNERPNIDWMEVQRTRAHDRMVIRPYSLSNTAPPSYDSVLDQCESQTSAPIPGHVCVAAPEPVHHSTKGARTVYVLGPSEESRSPSIATSLSASRESL